MFTVLTFRILGGGGFFSLVILPVALLFGYELSLSVGWKTSYGLLTYVCVCCQQWFQDQNVSLCIAFYVVVATMSFSLQLSAVVDGVYSEHSHTAGTFTMLSSSRVYVGGSQNTHALPGSRIHSNFVGCLRKVK